MNRNQSQGAASQAQNEEYFDLHVKGCGYLSRVREVPVGRRGSETFLACAVSALHGLCNDPSYSYFDLKVAGKEAEDLIRDLWQDVDKNRKVFVAFRAGDVYAEPYEVDERDRDTRQPTGRKVLRASIKGRLLQITHAKVDGEVVYQSEKSDRHEAEHGDADLSPGHDDGSEGDAEQPAQEARPVRSQERVARTERQSEGRNSTPARGAAQSRNVPRDGIRGRSMTA